jgi:two-component system, cell cycle sensor histidine kinase and response regulator CckA
VPATESGVAPRGAVRLDSAPAMNSDPQSSPEAEIARLREQLRNAQADKREAVMRFAAGFSHDMNNLLTPIMAYGFMIKEDLPPGDEAVEYIQEILDAADKTQLLIRTMQDVRAKGVVAGVMSVNDAVNTAVADFRGGLPPNITLTCTLDSGVTETRGEPTAMRRVLFELLKNAVTAMPSGGTISVSTHIEALPQDLTLGDEITVRDMGIGLDAETQRHIYEPYFTHWPTGHAKGLGLAIAAGLVRKTGGYIRCTSAPAAGATFDVLLRPAE